MTKQQKSIIEYHKLHPSKSRKEIAEAFGIRIYFVNRAFDRYKIEQQSSQTTLFNDKVSKPKKVGNKPVSWREVYTYHKALAPMVYSIPAKLFYLEMERTRWRYDNVYIANWKMTYINWLREQQRKDPRKTKGWSQGKLF